MSWLCQMVVSAWALVGVASGYAQSPQQFWLNGSPVETKIGRDSTTDADPLVAGQRVIRLTDISRAAVTVYPAAQDNAPAILVLPGGGYQVLADDLEGVEVCRWLNQLGVTAVLLHYRVPSAPPHNEPLDDAGDAFALMRGEGTAWHVDSRRIGVLGFSAGAHLAARLATSGKPINALMLIYAAYLADDETILSKVTPGYPPTFLVQTEDDPIGVRNSVAFYEALIAEHVAVELHLYAAGGHGYGLRKTRQPVTHWTDLAGPWLRSVNFGDGSK
jgi:acetyl esterase/lipase